jgi:hypothetical protein
MENLCDCGICAKVSFDYKACPERSRRIDN